MIEEQVKEVELESVSSSSKPFLIALVESKGHLYFSMKNGIPRERIRLIFEDTPKLRKTAYAIVQTLERSPRDAYTFYNLYHNNPDQMIGESNHLEFLLSLAALNYSPSNFQRHD